MKKTLIILPLIAILSYVVLCSYSGGAGATGSIEGTGATGSAGCSCHTAATSTTVALELDSAGTAVTHYIAGQTYTIKIKGTNTSATSLPKFGFQLTAVKLAGAGTTSAVNAGTLPTTGLPTSCQNTLVAGIHVIEHSARINATTGTGGSGTTYVESISWTAPATSGTGTIKLYGVVNAVNGTGTDLGDKYNYSSTTITELVVPVVAPITGTTSLCSGTTTTLSDATTSGTWTSGSTGVATISSSGVVTGVSAGTSIITYAVAGSGSVTTTVTVSATPASITGTTTVCTGSTVVLGETTTGGTWGTSNPSVSTVSSGTVTGVSAGVDTITYTLGSCASSVPVTVNPLPVAGSISGAASVCIGTPVTLSETTTGGTWTSGSSGIATVTSGGVVSGVSAGTAVISYSVTNSCGTAVATHSVSVATPPSAGTITGPTSVCQGSTITLADGVSGGTWSSSGAAASVTGSGVVTGVSAGTVNISYTVTGSCGSAATAYAVTVDPPPTVAGITGATSLCVGGTATLGDATFGGTWSSATPGLATVSSTGVVTASAVGTAVIDYSVTGTCGTTTVSYSISIAASGAPGGIVGVTDVCTGSFATLSDATAGGAWSGSTSVASVDASGVVHALASGTVTITYTVSTACGTAFVTHDISVSPSPTAGSVSGAGGVCQGSVISLTDGTPGGAWSSSATGIATVSASGVVTGVASGTAIISYTVTNSCGSVSASHAVLVTPLPDAGTLSGATNICVGSVSALTDAGTSGGIYTSSSTSIATVDAAGNVTGVSAGTDIISYTVSNSCGTSFAFFTITVSAPPVTGIITGADTVCAGATTIFIDTAAGGVWSSSNPSVATVSATGVVTGLASGTATISYSVTGICETLSATKSIIVNPLATAGSISGASRVCIGAHDTLSESVSGGVWSSSATAIATVSASGVVTGVSAGPVTISYAVTNSCNTAVATKSDTVLTHAACAAGVANVTASTFKVYPNPSNGMFTIELPAVGGQVAVTVTDLFGKVVDQHNTDNNTGTISMDLAHLPAGNYMIKVAAGMVTYREKITIW